MAAENQSKDSHEDSPADGKATGDGTPKKSVGPIEIDVHDESASVKDKGRENREK